MKELIRFWKERDYNSIYIILKEQGYDYTIDNLKKDFNKISSIEMFCYLIYLLSNEYSVKNTILACDFLLYTDTFFYSVHPVIRMILQHAIEMFPSEKKLLEWVICTYESNPESPFEEWEINLYKKKLSD